MASTVEKNIGTIQIGIRLDNERAVILSRIADSIGEGSKSKAVVLLLDMYGGKILERAMQEKEIEQAVALTEVMRWRTPKLSNELIAYVAGMIRAGNMPEVAFSLASIPPRLFRDWNKRGRNDRNAGKESLYADWVTAIERAEAECEAEDIQRLRAHGRTTWTALAWRLERQYPDRYAQRKRIDGKVQHSLFPVVDWDRLSPAETKTLVELLRKASPEGDEVSGHYARPALELLPADVVDVIDGEAEEVHVAAEAPAVEDGKPGP